MRKTKARPEKQQTEQGGRDENRMELLHHAWMPGHHDDPKAETQGTYRPRREDARRLRARKGQAVPSGVHALRSAKLRGQGENRTAADARNRNREEKSKPSRQEMVGE